MKHNLKQTQFSKSLDLNNSLFLGDGVFTSARWQDGSIEFLQDHLTRLQDHAQFLGFSVDTDEIKQQLSFLTPDKHSNDRPSKIKIIAVRDNLKSEIIIQLSDLPLYPTKANLRIHPIPYNSPLARLKTISYLDRLWLRRQAEAKGYFDSVVCNEENFVMETSCANLFWIHDNTLFYPDPELPFLFGIMLQNIIKNTNDMKITAVKTRIEGIPQEACVYLSNCLMGAIPVESIGNRVFQSSYRNLSIKIRPT